MAIPLMLDVAMKDVLVIGGGPVGYKKSKVMLDNGAKVTCRSIDFVDGFKELEGCMLLEGGFEVGDLDNKDLVLIATGDGLLNNKLQELCRQRHLWCYRADDHRVSNFQFMSDGTVNGITIAVNTNGQSPKFSRELLERFIGTLTEDDFRNLEALSKLRLETINNKPQPIN
jgi:siroheme synthase-like protein